MRGKRPNIVSAEALNTISREIAHVTYERAKFVNGGSLFNPFAMYTALATPTELFAERVDAAKVLPDFEERVEAAMAPRQPRREPPLVPYTVLPVATQGLPPSN